MSVRRLASLLVIAVAGAASLATSPPPPSAPPSLDETVEGTAELSAEHPAIVRLVDIRVSGLDPKLSGRASVVLTPTASGSDPDLDGAGEIRASIVGREAGSSTATVGPSGAFRSLLDSAKPPRPVDLVCAEGACEGHFALVVDAVGLERAQTVNVDWRVAAHVDLWAGVPPGGRTPIAMTAREPEDGAAAVTSAEAIGAETRIDTKNRLAMWHVSLTLGEETLAERPGWPLIALGHLRSTGTVIAKPNDTVGDPIPGLFIEGVGDQAGNGLDLQPRDEMEFEPFWSCVADDVCSTEYTVGLVLYDQRPDVAIDAGWELDVQAIAADSRTLPVKIIAKPIPPMPMISATIRGTFVTGSEGSVGETGYRVMERPGAAGRDDQWDGLRAPAYGIFRATMTSTGSVPLPSDGFFLSFGPRSGSPTMVLGREVAYAFSPGSAGCLRVPDCDLSGELTSGVGFRTGTLKPGWQVTVEWELELGMGTTAVNGDSELSIETYDRASPTASLSP